ncbi:class A beta-lactamase [Staphylococcus pseudoxylosus]|uniref:class A beta-lactamase n=1 Tax=Staphylococcus pseudoxylosus TaxID=2282419 RepID=UPI0029905E46|nr:class A beta-lactamase [Staphylococcus pseudoxylosus]MDW8796989.1 class A beta-lactamase [Staphylococcus pseudoxylosus]MEB6037378.1 class A beta-lactamase [Staphylococcus pseudoxylosus]MEB7764388.1 class A beta-lactamase [Staphylococcus pseudoxylosus]MEB8087695.1 class A beta-lactamase [Staphylococcus pseudoxylosus]
MKKIILVTLVSMFTLILAYLTHYDSASASELKHIEQENDVTIGVYGMNTDNGKVYKHNADERFAFASTYKAIASGILLNNMPNGKLNKKIKINEQDIVAYSPVTEKYIGKTMSLKSLVQASMLQSDNTANNKIINEIGGIEGFNNELKSLGDYISKPQRLEPDLNDYDPTKIADTTTPRAAATTLHKLLASKQMDKDNQALLKQVMIENETGDSLIKAGVPKEYTVGDKSGQALTYGTRNDLAFIYTDKHRKPIILAVYTKQDQKNAKPDDKIIAAAAKEAIKKLK